MVGGGGEVDPQHQPLARRIDDVRVRCGSLIFAKLHVAIRGRQIDVKLVVLGKARMERETEQALLVFGRDLRRHVEKRRRIDLAGRQIHDADETGLLDHEEAARVAHGRRCEKRLRQSGRDPHGAQAKRLGRRIRVPAINDFSRVGAGEVVGALGIGANDPRDHGTPRCWVGVGLGKWSGRRGRQRVTLVRTAGVEPARACPRDFKSLASTSFATSALVRRLSGEGLKRKRVGDR